jgi:hypothetical protein
LISCKRDSQSLLRQIIDAGCPVDESLSTGLTISQCGGSTIMDTRHGIRLLLDIAIAWDGPGPLTIASPGGVVVPWGFLDVIWLTPKPIHVRKKRKEPKKKLTGGIYKFPQGAEFPYDLVLNHRFDSGLKLRPGGAVAGLLLGIVPKLMPRNYQHCTSVLADLVLFDILGGEHRGSMELDVDRSENMRPPSSLVREGLYAQADPDPFAPIADNAKAMLRKVARVQSQPVMQNSNRQAGSTNGRIREA